MEFVKGRIITDPELGELSPSDRRKAWFSLTETLGWLHSIDPDSIGLSDFGKKTGFYARHCNTFSRIEAQQAKVKDIKTGEVLGRAHPDYDEIIEFVRANLPTEEFRSLHHSLNLGPGAVVGYFKKAGFSCDEDIMDKYLKQVLVVADKSSPAASRHEWTAA